MLMFSQIPSLFNALITFCYRFPCYFISYLPARLSLEIMTILCRCENIETAEGVPLDVTGVAQVMQTQSK